MLDDDDLPPPRPTFDDKTAWGRIIGRDARKYARLWGCGDLSDPLSKECFDLECKFMLMAHHEAENALFGPIGERGPGGFSKELDLEQFALAWRPPSLSELIDEVIAERIAAERAARDPDPESRH